MTKPARKLMAIWCQCRLPALLLALSAGAHNSLAQTNVPGPDKPALAPAGTNAASTIDARLALLRQMMPSYVGSQRDAAENRLIFSTANNDVTDSYGGTMSCNIVAFVYGNQTLPRTICLHLTSTAPAERFRTAHEVNIRQNDVFFSPNVISYDNKSVTGAGIVEQIFPELTLEQLHDVAFARAVFFQVGSDNYEVPPAQRQSWRLLWTYFALKRAQLAAQAGQPAPLPPISQDESNFQAGLKAKEAQRTAVLNRALRSNQEAAAQGDAYGLLRMGERYRDGEGVDQDLAKARDYLQKAAAAGSPTASDELSALPH